MLSNLKKVRIRENLTIKQLSIISSISTSYLYELENLSKINPNYKIVKRLTKALNTTIEELEEIS